MDKIKRILAFCNLLEYDENRLSITNIALIGLIFKLVITPQVDWPSIVAVITAFGNYSHKRYINSQVSDDSNGQVNPKPSNPSA